MNQRVITAGAALIFIAAPANAVDVNFNGLVVNICSLTATPGTIGSEGDGLTLSSDGLGGASAALVVVATGGLPSLLFSAPAVTTPGGFSGSVTGSIAYSSLGGISQAYTTSASTKALNGLLDTVTIRAKAVSTNGFSSGTYGVRTVVTCQQ